MAKTSGFVLTENTFSDLGSLLARCYYYYIMRATYSLARTRSASGGTPTRLSFQIVRV